MSARDVPLGDRPRPDKEAADIGVSEAYLERLHRPETEDEMALAHLVDALRAPGTPEELSGLGAATAAFSTARAETSASGSVVALSSRRRRSVLSAGVAVGVAVASVALAGTAAAALTGSLPGALQQLAHDAFNAPAPSPHPAPDATQVAGSSGTTQRPSGPAATPGAPALAGLCHAYEVRSSTAPAAAFSSLEAAAKAHGQTVAAYCAVSIGRPGTAPAVGPMPPAGQSGQPTAPPGLTHKPTTPPGLTHKPTAPPGLTHKPTTPPGLTHKPTTPPGQAHKPTTPPGQALKPTTPPGQAHKPTASPKA